MTGRGWSPIVACLVTALLAAPCPASARHRKHNPKRAAPAAQQAKPEGAAPEADQGAIDNENAEAPESAPAAPEPRAELPRARAIPAQAPDDGTASPPRPPPAATAAALVSAGDAGALALGRREAARLAAGRIEVAAALGLDVGRRQFTYSDPIGAVPRPYLLAAAPLATFELEVYPLASAGIPILRDLGLRGRVSRAFALGSTTTSGAPLDNSWTRFTGELRGRVLVPGWHGLQLGVSAGVDASYFELATEADVGALVPSARTLSVRAGADARVRLAGRLSLLAGGAYLATISRGAIYDQFRRPRVAGVDGELGLAIALGAGLEGRLAGRYTRYFASFDPEVGDAAVAGGALDQQTQLGVALRYAH
jgi:hypothetical protein